MSYIFNYCPSLNNIILDNIDTSNVIDMKYMFSDCKAISSLNLKSFNTKQLKEMKYMFSGYIKFNKFRNGE